MWAAAATDPENCKRLTGEQAITKKEHFRRPRAYGYNTLFQEKNEGYRKGSVNNYRNKWRQSTWEAGTKDPEFSKSLRTLRMAETCSKNGSYFMGSAERSSKNVQGTLEYLRDSSPFQSKRRNTCTWLAGTRGSDLSGNSEDEAPGLGCKHGHWSECLNGLYYVIEYRQPA